MGCTWSNLNAHAKEIVVAGQSMGESLSPIFTIGVLMRKGAPRIKKFRNHAIINVLNGEIWWPSTENLSSLQSWSISCGPGCVSPSAGANHATASNPEALVRNTRNIARSSRKLKTAEECCAEREGEWRNVTRDGKGGRDSTLGARSICSFRCFVFPINRKHRSVVRYTWIPRMYMATLGYKGKVSILKCWKTLYF